MPFFSSTFKASVSGGKKASESFENGMLPANRKTILDVIRSGIRSKGDITQQ